MTDLEGATLEDLRTHALNLFPHAIISEDKDGYIQIDTGMYVDKDGFLREDAVG